MKQLSALKMLFWRRNKSKIGPVVDQFRNGSEAGCESAKNVVLKRQLKNLCSLSQRRNGPDSDSYDRQLTIKSTGLCLSVSRTSWNAFFYISFECFTCVFVCKGRFIPFVSVLLRFRRPTGNLSERTDFLDSFFPERKLNFFRVESTPIVNERWISCWFRPHLFSMAPNRLNKKVDGCRQCHWEYDAILSHRICVE